MNKVEAAEKRFSEEYPQRPSSFWDNKMIPSKFCTREWSKEDVSELFDGGAWIEQTIDKKFMLPTALDVRAYVLLEKAEKRFGGKMTSLFEDEEMPSCKSIYGLCE